MKYKLLSILIAGTMLTACGGSDNDTTEPTPPPPPAAVTVDANDAKAINLTVTGFDTVTGALSFDLKDADGVAITNAQDYDIAFLGFQNPKAITSKPKAWKRWHVAQLYRCDTASEAPCQGTLTETTTKGSYLFDATDFDLSSGDPAKFVTEYKVGIEIKGKLASNPVELISSPAI